MRGKSFGLTLNSWGTVCFKRNVTRTLQHFSLICTKRFSFIFLLFVCGLSPFLQQSLCFYLVTKSDSDFFLGTVTSYVRNWIFCSCWKEVFYGQFPESSPSQGLISTHNSETLLTDFGLIAFLCLNCIIYKRKMIMSAPHPVPIFFSQWESLKALGLLYETYFRNALLAAGTVRQMPQRLKCWDFK